MSDCFSRQLRIPKFTPHYTRVFRVVKTTHFPVHFTAALRGHCTVRAVFHPSFSSEFVRNERRSYLVVVGAFGADRECQLAGNCQPTTTATAVWSS
jgi:hypothetical protein